MKSNTPQTRRPASGRSLAALASALCLPLALQLASAQESEELMRGLSLEELADVPAIASAKHPATLFNAPTGSFVFDEDAISRLPVDSIPEMLRYAPGVHIVRPSNGIWGLGMRGINSRFFNRVAFTVDEQNVYSTIFAGLFGSQHDLLMEDVSSIEVAYGPGGGTWDNNAVNGMVNVLMKTAFETEGSFLKTTLGTESRGVSGRSGWTINDSTAARVYFKAGNRDSSLTRFDYENDWDTARLGFRLDTRPSTRDLISVSSEVFYSNLGYAYNLANFETGDLEFRADDESLKGANAQIKWTRTNSEDSEYSIRSWIAYSELRAPYAAFDITTAGTEARGRFRIHQDHVLNLNLGAAYDTEDTYSTLASDFSEEVLANSAVYTGFQDEWTLIPEKLELSWGLDFRYEHKSEIDTLSPNARLIYQLDENQRVWVSFSQAKRTTPVSLSVIESLRSGKVIDEFINVPTPGGTIVIDRSLTDANSSVELDTEQLDAFEAGYRTQFADEAGTFWINAFHYQYDNIFARIGNSSSPVLFVENPYLDVQGSYTNLLDGEAYGFEAYLSWAFDESTRLSLSYSHLTDSFHSLVDTADPFVLSSIQFSIDEFDNSTPGHIASLNLSTDLTSEVELDIGLRYSSEYDFAKGLQPGVFQGDARISWFPSENLKLSLVGRNLFDETTQEARLKDFFGHWTEMKRELYLEVTAEF